MLLQIAMGTFVLAFIGNGFVRSAQRSVLFPGAVPPGMRRRILVLAYFTAIVSCVILFGISTIPDIIRQACACCSCGPPAAPQPCASAPEMLLRGGVPVWQRPERAAHARAGRARTL